MTQEVPIVDKSEYEEYQPSEQNGLIEELEPDDHDPEYLLEDGEIKDRQYRQNSQFQLDFDYFFNQTEIYQFT